MDFEPERESRRETSEETRLLRQVRRGMPVYDQDGEPVGRVEHVVPGNLSEGSAELGVGPDEVTYSGVQEEGSMWDAFEDTFEPVEEIDKDMMADMRRRGFLRIDGPDLTPAGRYILARQIESVGPDGVRLDVTRDELTRD